MLRADILLDIGEGSSRPRRVSFETAGLKRRARPAEDRAPLSDPVPHRQRHKVGSRRVEGRGARRREQRGSFRKESLPSLRETGSDLSFAVASQQTREDGGAWHHKNMLGDSMMWLRSSTPVFNPCSTAAARVQHSGWEPKAARPAKVLARKQKLAALQHVRRSRSLTPQEKHQYEKLECQLSGQTRWEKTSPGPKAHGSGIDARQKGMKSPGLQPIEQAPDLSSGAAPDDINTLQSSTECTPAAVEPEPERKPTVQKQVEASGLTTNTTLSSDTEAEAEAKAKAEVAVQPEPEPEPDLEMDTDQACMRVSNKRVGRSLVGASLSAMGRPVVLVGPSGVGKHELQSYLVTTHSDKFALPCRCTTHPEIGESAAWELIEPIEMQQHISAGWLAVHYEEHDHSWGVTLSACEAVINEGKSPVLILPLREYKRYRSDLLPTHVKGGQNGDGAGPEDNNDDADIDAELPGDSENASPRMFSGPGSALQVLRARFVLVRPAKEQELVDRLSTKHVLTDDARQAASAQAFADLKRASDFDFDAVATTSVEDLALAAQAVIGGVVPLDLTHVKNASEAKPIDQDVGAADSNSLPRLSGFRDQDRMSAERGNINDFVGYDARQHFFDLFQKESKWRSENELQFSLQKIESQGLFPWGGRPGSQATDRGEREQRQGRNVYKQHRHDVDECDDMALDKPASETAPGTRQTYMLDSARGKLLRSCGDLNVPPMPSLIIGRKRDSTINLNNFRIGDTMAVALESGLSQLTKQGIELVQLHLASLSCTAIGSVHLCRPLATLPSLRLLELSHNTLGRQGGDALAAAIENHASLRTILLQSTKLPDRSIAKILIAALTVGHLTDLDISKNDIGHDVPSVGAKALARLIESNTPLQRLNVGWNSLRGSAAELVGMSLQSNSYLVSIELCWNGLSDGGAEWLAESIRESQYLQEVGLAHNTIGERGAYVLADCLKENNGLRLLKLDGNPIGRHGMRAILRAIRDICLFGWPRRVTLTNCNMTVTDKRQKFLDRNRPNDANRPGGEWVCDLSKPFERATAWELVDLAWTQPGQNWDGETLDGKPFDLPEPGENEVWTRDDYKDRTGGEGLPKEGILRVKYVASPRLPRLDDVVSEELYSRLRSHINKNGGSAVGLEILQSACEEFYFTSYQAGMFLTLFKDSASKVRTATSLLPRIVDWVNVTSNFFDWLTVHEMQMLQSPAYAGQLFDFVPTNPTGRYRLNLVSPVDRSIANYMMAVSCEDEARRRAQRGEIINTSQKGDWDNFRNEKLTSTYAAGEYADAFGDPMYYGERRQSAKDDVNKICGAGAAFNIDDENVEPFPPTGVLEFDYVSTDVAHRIAGQSPMHPQVFDQLVLDLGEIWSAIHVYSAGSEPEGQEDNSRSAVGGSNDAQTATKEKHTQNVQKSLGGRDGHGPRSQAHKRNHGHGHGRRHRHRRRNRPVTKKEQLESLPTDAGSAVVIQSAWRGWFGRHKSRVRRYALKAMQDQQKVNNETTQLKCLEMRRKLAQVRDRESKRAHERTASRQQMLGKLAHVVDPITSKLPTGAKDEETDEGGNEHSDVFDMARLILLHRRSPAKRQCWWLPKELRKMLCATEEEREQRVGARCCMMLRRATLEHFFSVAQLEHVLKIVPRSHRIDAIVTLWAKITDIENFRVYDYLDFSALGQTHQAEHSEKHLQSGTTIDLASYTQISERIGAANLFNPLRPEGFYRLDLRSCDCRRTAACIMALTQERGEQLANQHYNDERFHAGQSWLTDIPHLGVFETEFVTPKHSANLFVRLDLARRLLMPGHGRGRWKAVREELRESTGDPQEADGEAEEPMELLPDGNLAPHGWRRESIEKSQRTLAEQISMVG